MVEEPFYDLEGQIAIDLPGARALFTTPTWGDVRQTEAVIGQRLGVAPMSVRQVHGATVFDLDVAQTSGTPIAEADALVTKRHGIAPMVLTADCVPVLIAGGGAVAAVHAGWKGLRDGVIAAAVSTLRARTEQTAEPIAAAIGPAAGRCCYEVGDDLHELFAGRGEGFRTGRNLDLKAIARLQLNQAGVSEVHDCGVCTICSEPARAFSYRRDGEASGRQGALVWLS